MYVISGIKAIDTNINVKAAIKLLSVFYVPKMTENAKIIMAMGFLPTKSLKSKQLIFLLAFCVLT